MPIVVIYDNAIIQKKTNKNRSLFLIRFYWEADVNFLYLKVIADIYKVINILYLQTYDIITYSPSFYLNGSKTKGAWVWNYAWQPIDPIYRIRVIK